MIEITRDRTGAGFGRRRQSRSALRALGFVLVFAAVYLGFIVTPFGQWIDAGSFGALSVLNRPLGDTAAAFRLAGPVALAAVALISGLVALLQRRRRSVLQALAILVVSAAGSEGLKRILPRPDLGGNGYPENTFPSGHMAIALSLAAAIVVMLPPRRWALPASVIALIVAAGVGCASIVSYAHRPSDVIGAVLVVGIVTSSVLWRRPSAARRRPAPAAAAAACVLAGASAVLAGVLLHGAAPGAGEALEALGWLTLCGAIVGLGTAAGPEMRSVSRDPVETPPIGSDGDATLNGLGPAPVRPGRRRPRPARSAAPEAGPHPD